MAGDGTHTHMKITVEVPYSVWLLSHPLQEHALSLAFQTPDPWPIKYFLSKFAPNYSKNFIKTNKNRLYNIIWKAVDVFSQQRQRRQSIFSRRHGRQKSVTLWRFKKTNFKSSTTTRSSFVDVEGMKEVKQMITLLAITGQFIPQNRCQSERLRKQMLINTHKVNRCEWRL